MSRPAPAATTRHPSCARLRFVSAPRRIAIATGKAYAYYGSSCEYGQGDMGRTVTWRTSGSAGSPLDAMSGRRATPPGPSGHPGPGDSPPAPAATPGHIAAKLKLDKTPRRPPSASRRGRPDRAGACPLAPAVAGLSRHRRAPPSTGTATATAHGLRERRRGPVNKKALTRPRSSELSCSVDQIRSDQIRPCRAGVSHPWMEMTGRRSSALVSSSTS